MKKIILILVLVSGIIFSYTSFTQADEISDAVSYLKAQDDSSWVTMALVAAGEAVDVDYLKSTSGSTAISLETPILALTAAGEDPRTFPDTDLISQLKGFYDGTQIGDASGVNDDIFGILALVSAGESVLSSEVQGAKEFVLSNQNADGGWGWAVGADSDTNDTAAGIMALMASGVGGSDPPIEDAIDYLKAAQNDDGGFPYDPKSSFGTASDASSTAWVISAILKLGESPTSWTNNSNNPVDFLWSLQTEDGYFENTPGAGETGFTPTETAYAVIALSDKTLPVGIIDGPAPAPEVDFRIEGKDTLICKGSVEAATAMDVVINAADSCGYTYVIEELSFGLFMRNINDEEPEGLAGWLYRVNLELPNVGAANYELAEGDEVLWYYAEFENEPLRLTIIEEKDLYSVGESVEGIVESFDGVNWNNVVEADVLMNGSSVLTNSGGLFEIEISESGVFGIRAEKDEFVRSDSSTIIAGDASGSIDLDVEIVEEGGDGDSGGGGDPPEVGFSVTPSQLSFGKLEPGSFVTQDVSLTNEGQKDLNIKAVVQGDEVFSFLNIAGVVWSLFEMLLPPSVQESIEVKLSVPSEFSSFGSKQGMLIFWGESQ